MAISLGFINLFVPAKAHPDRKYPGGWARFRQDYADGAVFDDHLVRFRSGNPNDIEAMIDTLDAPIQKPSPNPMGGPAGRTAASSITGRLTLPCGWLQLAGDYRSARLEGTGRARGRLRRGPRAKSPHSAVHPFAQLGRLWCGRGSAADGRRPNAWAGSHAVDHHTPCTCSCSGRICAQRMTRSVRAPGGITSNVLFAALYIA